MLYKLTRQTSLDPGSGTKDGSGRIMHIPFAGPLDNIFLGEQQQSMLLLKP